MSDDTNTKYQIKVILGLLGLTGVLVVIGIVANIFNQISGNYHLSWWMSSSLKTTLKNIDSKNCKINQASSIKAKLGQDLQDNLKILVDLEVFSI